MSSRCTPSRWNPSRSYVRRARVLYSSTSSEILLRPSPSKPYRRTTRIASVPYPWDQNDGSPMTIPTSAFRWTRSILCSPRFPTCWPSTSIAKICSSVRRSQSRNHRSSSAIVTGASRPRNRMICGSENHFTHRRRSDDARGRRRIRSPRNTRRASNPPPAAGGLPKTLCPPPSRQGRGRMVTPAVIIPDRQRDGERAARRRPVDDGRVDIERCGPSLALRWIRAHAVVPECLPDARPVSELPRRCEIVAPRIVEARAEGGSAPHEERGEVGQGPGPRGRVPDIKVVEHPLLLAIGEHDHNPCGVVATELPVQVVVERSVRQCRGDVFSKGKRHDVGRRRLLRGAPGLPDEIQRREDPVV